MIYVLRAVENFEIQKKVLLKISNGMKFLMLFFGFPKTRIYKSEIFQADEILEGSEIIDIVNDITMDIRKFELFNSCSSLNLLKTSVHHRILQLNELKISIFLILAQFTSILIL